MKQFKILSIDAWRDEFGWQWNNSHTIGHLSTLPDTNRRLLSLLRKEGYLTDKSIGTVAIDDDQYNFVVVDKSTREPLIAVEYGGYQ